MRFCIAGLLIIWVCAGCAVVKTVPVTALPDPRSRMALLSLEGLPTNSIVGFEMSPVPACNGVVTWFSVTPIMSAFGTNAAVTNGIGANCCYLVTLSWTTDVRLAYRVLYRLQDSTRPHTWGTWNPISPWLDGNGTTLSYSTGAPEPGASLFCVEQRPLP